ncbi:MAG: MarR family transcriptional regulator [Alphaproteobacteria bacterium]|nr:MarR family transcriptional regulator [Alphaproteobacteria bacterium]
MSSTTERPDHLTLFAVFNEIAIIEQLSRARFEEVLPDGLKISQFGVLNHFVRLGGERGPAELARAFQVTKAAMTNTLGRLDARGLVEITPNPKDGRGKQVRITDQGRAVHAASIEALRPYLEHLSETFPTQRLAAVLPVLSELRACLDADRDQD